MFHKKCPWCNVIMIHLRGWVRVFFCLSSNFCFGNHGRKRESEKSAVSVCAPHRLVMCNNKSIWTQAKFIKTGRQNERGIKYWYIKSKHYCIIRHDGSLMKTQWNHFFVKQCTGCLLSSIGFLEIHVNVPDATSWTKKWGKLGDSNDSKI